MVEREIMPTPEQERPVSAEQTKQPSFEEKLRDLIEPKVNEEGRILREPWIENQKLKRLARMAIKPRNQTPEGLEKLLGKGDEWCLDEEVPEDEWSMVAGELNEERERLLKETEKKEAREALFGQNIEPYFGAVFEKGRYESYIRTGQIGRETNVILDVAKPRDRERWLLENVRAAMDGTIPNPEETWKKIVDFWRLDFSEAVRREKLSTEDKERFDREIRSVMAVCASARAMEQSDGAAATYLGFITESSPEHPYLDRQDDWAEYLLHGDKSKLAKVLENSLVASYYKELTASVGVELFVWRKKGSEDILLRNKSEEEAKKEGYKEAPGEWDGKVNKAVFIKGEKEGKFDFREGTMAYYLAEKRGGMNKYIEEVLLRDVKIEGDYEESEKWAAAKLACDAFLVDKYTRWEYELNREESGKIGEKGGELKPSLSWGGDPLRALLEPSFLPRRIKEKYTGAPFVLKGIDEAFRPEGVLKDKDALKASIPEIKLKDYARWSEALWKFLGNSQGSNIPIFSDRVLGEDLPEIARLLDQVYGFAVKKKAGREIVGVMMAKIILTKTEALVSERYGERSEERTLDFFGRVGENTKLVEGVRAYLFGPSGRMKSGFIARMENPESGIGLIFNKDAKKDLKKAHDELSAMSKSKKDILGDKISKVGKVLYAIFKGTGDTFSNR